MRRKINRMLSFGLALIMMFSIAGCGSNAQPQAEIDPDTPVSEVQFPLKETAGIILYYQCTGNLNAGSE